MPSVMAFSQGTADIGIFMGTWVLQYTEQHLSSVRISRREYPLTS